MENAQLPIPVAIQCELLLELMSTVAARLARLEARETQADQRASYAAERAKILRGRLTFDINNEAEISKLMTHYDQYASVLAVKLQAAPVASSASM
ncbi:hypothetical protein [Azohydromonas lata]|uniref:hypothetical protein n=1 Tax=Azohydromonas lata TaxID=45677 RepID=UPI0008310BCF|nr:hypothetical protein [Azohydromonas lata]